MGVYFGTTEITNVDWIPGDKDITQVFFATNEVFTVWSTYDGTLPAQYTANGDYLADYRIYGSAGGVGDRTVNLFDKNNYNLIRANAGSGQNILYGDPNDAPYAVYIPVTGGETYSFYSQATLKSSCFTMDTPALGVSIVLNGANTFDTTNVRTAPADAKYLIVFLELGSAAQDRINSDLAILTIVKSSTAPTSYIPYGYEVDMSVSDGTISTTTPIYIGDTPLGEDEYVDYGVRKIYRMSGGVLTPTDPPVPLPALPTVDGTNIVDYAGQSAAVPSKLYAKYRKEGF